MEGSREASPCKHLPGVITVLAVDDHPLVRDGVNFAIQAERDMKVVAEASNGQEAIDLFRLHRPDVTLMDLQMPGMNGIDAMLVIRQSSHPHESS